MTTTTVGVHLIASGAATLLACLAILRHSSSERRGLPYAITSLACCLMFFGFFSSPLLDGAVDEAYAAAYVAPTPVEVEFPDLGLAVTPPPAPWTRVEPETLNPDCVLAYVNPDTQVFFLILAEAFGVGAEPDSEALITMAREHLAAVASEFELEPASSAVVDEVEGVRFASRAVIDGRELSYVHWLASSGGHAYQLITGGARESRADIESAARILLGHIRLESPPAEARTVTEFRSERTGVIVEFPRGEWRAWDGLEDAFPEAEFGGLRGNHGGFVVLPVPNLGHPLTIDDALSALLIPINFSLHDGLRTQRESLHGRSELWIRTQRDVDGTSYEYCMRAVRTEHHVVLVVAWDARMEDFECVADVVGSVRFEPPTRLPVADHLSAREEVVAARSHNEIGLQLFGAGRLAASGRHFHVAVELDPGDATYLSNLGEVLARSDRHSELIEIFERSGDLLDRHPELQAALASSHAQLGHRIRSVELYERLFARGYRDLDHLENFVLALREEGRSGEAVHWAERYRAVSDSPPAAMLHARMLHADARVSEAIQLLEGYGDRFDVDLLMTLADLYQANDRTRDAVEIIDRVLARGYDNAQTHYQRGRLMFEMGRHDEAKVSLEAALRHAPEQRSIRTFLDHVSALLGEGDNSSIKTVIDPVPLPPELSPVADSACADGFGASFLRRARAVSWNDEDDSLTTTYYQSIGIEDSIGVRRFRTITHGFDPLSESLYVNRLEVFDGDGNLVATGRVEDCYVLDDSENELVSQRRILHIPVPGLKPGHRLELTMTSRRKIGAEPVRFVQHGFSSSIPVRQSVLWVASTAPALTWSVENTGQPRRLDGGLLWVHEDPPTRVEESLSRDPEDYLPRVAVGTSATNWSDLGSDYLSMIEHRLPVAAAIPERARAITSEHDTRFARACALARHVRDFCQYRGIEFGTRGLVMQPVERVLADGFGDCKDHSLLLWQLLRSAGIEAHLAIASTDQGIHEAFPSLAQFNHMVVWLPADPTHETDGPGHVFDTTYKNASVTTTPLGLEGRQILVLDPESPHLVTVPETSVGEHGLTGTREVWIESTGTLRVEESITVRGHHGAMLRSYLRTSAPRDRVHDLSRLLSMTNVDVRDLDAEFTDLDAPDRPLRMRLRYRILDALRRHGNELLGVLPFPWELRYTRGDSAGPRRTPLEFPVPLDLHVTTRVHWEPSGSRPVLGEVIRERAGEFGSWRIEHESGDGSVTISTRLVTPRAWFPAGRYAEFVQHQDSARRAVTPPIRMTVVRQP